MWCTSKLRSKGERREGKSEREVEGERGREKGRGRLVERRYLYLLQQGCKLTYSSPSSSSKYVSADLRNECDNGEAVKRI
jgi:hypothetical protein